MWNDEVILISNQITTDEIGDSVKNEIRRTIFSNEKSISQSEFYQAQAVGLKPQLKLVVKRVDYENEQQAEYQGNRYKILRTFKVNSEEIELVLEGDNYGHSKVGD